MRQELCNYGNLLLRGTRIIIPKELCKRVLELAHEGHQGIVKTKSMLRIKVWWPGMDKQVVRLCRTCHGCRVNSEFRRPEPITRTLPPSGPWQDRHSRTSTHGENIFVIVDYYSRYSEAVIMKTVTSTTIVRVLERIFGRLGLPYSRRSDNGSQFVSGAFQNFLRDNGVEHRRITPLAPWQNGECELQNCTLMKAVPIAHSEGKYWRRELTKLLIAHRSTPHSSTGATPFFLMYGREMRTKLADLCREQIVLDEATRDKDWAYKLKGNAYADSKRCAQESSIEVGDQLLVRAPKLNKLSSNFSPVPRTVIAKKRRGTDDRTRRCFTTSSYKPLQATSASDDSELPLGHICWRMKQNNSFV